MSEYGDPIERAPGLTGTPSPAGGDEPDEGQHTAAYPVTRLDGVEEPDPGEAFSPVETPEASSAEGADPAPDDRGSLDAAAADTDAPAESEAAIESELRADDLGGDPFAEWPQALSAEVIEDIPAEGESVEHAAGEIEVPDGYTVLEGTPTGHRRSVALVVSRFNGNLTNRMLASAIEALEDAGVASDAVTVMPVPGAFELPLAAMALAKTRRYACVVALGAIVRGETAHFDYIAAEAASGLQLAAIETGVPVAFGVLTVENVEQAEARIDRAAEAVRTALEMADVFAQLRASARS